ncbi:hypothetical protein Noda2021_12350 [Candidatus Dependentiae bacterium Noda2021]|nr:hypothetical protein Noda2021_12350 [Candidatus Dependentiae bacterium Noda2021]
MKNVQFSLITIALLANALTHCMDKFTFIKTVAPALPKYVAAAAGMEIATTITHEVGHAIPSNHFFGNLHGFSFFGTPKIQSQVGDVTITVGANPLGKSSALLHNVAIQDNDYKLLAITASAAGPLCGMIGTCVFKKALLKTSLNKKVITWTSRLVHANNLSSFVPVSRKDTQNPNALITSDGQHMVNLYTAYKNNKVCDLSGNVIEK